jgi:hypothetical protein
MAGHLRSSISYAITGALTSLSASPRLTRSSEDSLKRVGKKIMIMRLLLISRKMRRHSYIQLIENRFTESLMLRTLSFVIPVGVLTLEEAHYNYTEIQLTKRMLDAATQTGMVVVSTTE